MTDPVWQAQEELENPSIAGIAPESGLFVIPGPTATETKLNPKTSSRGEVNPKAPHLDMELTLIFPLLILLTAVLAFVLGFVLGKNTYNNSWVSRVEELEKSVQSVLTAGPEVKWVASTQPPKPSVSTTKEVKPSSVLKAPTPEEIRERRDKELEAEMLAATIKKSGSHRGGFTTPEGFA